MREAERAELGLALRRVGRLERGVDISGMAAELGYPLSRLVPDDRDQGAGANLLEVGLPVPLPVEARNVADRRATQHQPSRLGKLGEALRQLGNEMDVVVGV